MADAVLEVDRIAKRYGKVRALDELSFTVRAGELFGLAGGSGAGKTTALLIAAGVLTPDTGQVRWRAQPIDAHTRSSIGYLPGDRGLYPRMRLADQLGYLAALHGLSREAARHNAEYWIERFGLRGCDRSPVGALGLAGRRRAELAAALVHEPELLVLDEPFHELDDASRGMFDEVLREKAKAGVPVLLASDRFDHLEQLCDRIAVVHNGQMVVVGSVAELSDNAPMTLVIDAPDAGPDWTNALTGCEVISVQGSRYLLALDPGIDEQLVLRAAQATGPVREFSQRRASLAQRYHATIGQGWERC